jgi:heat-inducible transcriptional repressor
VVEERRLDVLRAIVEDYVRTQEPVGSKALAARHHLGVSPATIRNDMAALEDEGYVTHPHTSAGRMPTDKGYRLFVDRLATVKPLSPAERRAIVTFLDEAVDLDDVVDRTVRLLAQLTRQVAVVQYPSLTRSSVRHVELVELGGTRLLLVLITDTGRVEQRVVDVGAPVDPPVVTALREQVNATVDGLPLGEVATRLAEISDAMPPQHRAVTVPVATALMEMVVEQREERVVLAGTANLARFKQDFPQSIGPVLEALEEQVVLLRLLGEATVPDEVTVRIGHENEHEGLTSTSVVAVGYGGASAPLARLGVLGPTRMDYPSAMGAVRAVARYVGRILAAG